MNCTLSPAASLNIHIKSAAICFVIILLFCPGCIYKGNISYNINELDNDTSKLPIRAYLVFDNTIDNSIYSTRNVVLWHGVDIETKPGLRAMIYSAFRSTFNTLFTDNCINPALISNYDVIIIPRIEFNSGALTLSATLKEAVTDKIINTYTTTEKIYHNVQLSTSSDTLYAISMIPPIAVLTSPFIVMNTTEDVGKQAKSDLEGSIRRALNRITTDIRTDELLLSRIGKNN